MPYLLALLTGIVVVAVLIAFGLSRAFVRPVQKLAENLGQPELMDDEGIYKEIRAQNTQISEIVGEMCIEHDVTISVSVRSKDQIKPQSLPYHKSIVTEGIRYNPGGFNA